MSTDICVHGMVGSCPDCAPDRIDVGPSPSLEGVPIGDTNGAPWAASTEGRVEWPFFQVKRLKPDGSLDWFTWHWTRRGARRAVALYQQTGRVVGIRP